MSSISLIQSVAKVRQLQLFGKLNQLKYAKFAVSSSSLKVFFFFAISRCMVSEDYHIFGIGSGPKCYQEQRMLKIKQDYCMKLQ